MGSPLARDLKALILRIGKHEGNRGIAGIPRLPSPPQLWLPPPPPHSDIGITWLPTADRGQSLPSFLRTTVFSLPPLLVPSLNALKLRSPTRYNRILGESACSWTVGFLSPNWK